MRYQKQRYIDPATVGLSGVALNAAKTSNAIDLSGLEQITLEVDYTYSAGTNLELYFEVTDDLSGTPTWRRLQSESTSSGTTTLSDWKYVKVVGAADQEFPVTFPVNYKAIRIVASMTGSPDTGDLLSVGVRLGATG